MGHTDAVKWWNSLNDAQKKHIQNTHGNLKTVLTGFSNSEKSAFMKMYQNDQKFFLLKTGDKYKQSQTESGLTDWTTFINNNND